MIMRNLQSASYALPKTIALAAYAYNTPIARIKVRSTGIREIPTAIPGFRYAPSRLR